jgi:hypothetical protein
MELDNTFGVDPIVEDDGQVEVESTQEETQDTTETETPEESGQVEESETEEQQPQVETKILGKFKSQDDLANAYTNLEREYTRMRQEMVKQPQQVAPQQEQPQDNNEEAQLIAWYNQEVQTNPINANAVLAQYMAQKEISKTQQNEPDPVIQEMIRERQTTQHINNLASRFPDLYDYTEPMSNIIADMVTLNPSLKGNPQVFEMAYYQAKISSLENNAKTAFENGKKSAFESKAAKQKVNNELGKTKTNDALPDGITLIPEGDGIFL